MLNDALDKKNSEIYKKIGEKIALKRKKKKKKSSRYFKKIKH